jgi:hypothetical protein
MQFCNLPLVQRNLRRLLSGNEASLIVNKTLLTRNRDGVTPFG